MDIDERLIGLTIRRLPQKTVAATPGFGEARDLVHHVSHSEPARETEEGLMRVFTLD